jgi:hypothetical protein
MTLQLEVRQQVVISTAHMAQSDNAVLDQLAQDKPTLVREYPYGWEIIIATDDHRKDWEATSGSYDISDDLLVNILKLWKAVPGLYSIVFDCDGPQVEGLATYYW